MLTELLIGLWAVSVVAGAEEPVSGWADDFRDIGRLHAAKHVEQAGGGGLTISGGEQVWSLPSSAPFSSGTFSGSVVVTGETRERETVTLFSRVFQPGADFRLSGETVETAGEGARVRLYPGDEGGFPGGGKAVVAGWGTAPGRAFCGGEGAKPGGKGSRGAKESLLAWTGEPIRIAPGSSYAFSFVVGAGRAQESAPVLAVELFDAEDSSLYRREVLKGRDVPESGRAEFATMAKCSLVAGVPLSANDPTAGFRVLSYGGGSSCVLLGPVYLTAQDGEYRAPLLDSLSSLTAWRRIEYSFDQNESVHAPDCACAPGSPVTPVLLRYGLSDSETVTADRTTEAEVGGISVCAVPPGAAGRYMAISILLKGRAEAGDVDPSLAPRNSAYFAGLRPVVRSVKVRYFARAAEAVSDLVVPSSIRKWSRIGYRAEVPEGASVRVDVLGADGTEILRDIPADYIPGPELDVFSHHAIRLRARLYDNPNDRKRRPVLKSWEVSWERESGRLSIRPGTFRPDRGETVRGLVHMAKAVGFSVSVRDSRGKLVRRLAERKAGRGTADFTWDGRSTAGAPVPPGEYYVTSTSTDGVATRKVRVAR